MPIVRSYGCPDCGHVMDVTLTMKQVNRKPPECPVCSERTNQIFKPVALGGSLRARAVALAQDIAAKDYGVADFQVDSHEGSTPKVRYKDQSAPPAQWGASREVIEGAIAMGREDRLKHGSALDLIKQEPDLIAISKQRAMKVW